MRPERRRRVGLLVLGLVVAVLVWAARSGPADGPLAERLTHRLIEAPLVAVASAGSAVVEAVAEPLRREALHERIRGLEARVAEIETENAGLAEVARENRRLTELLGMADVAEREARAARVIAAGSRPRTLVIDLGERDGVVADAAVVAAGGLVGRVYRAGARTSVVQLTIDSTSGLGALIERTALHGVVAGIGDGLRLRYVPAVEDVVLGDKVLTSGLDRMYPKGLVVGRVTEVEPGPDAFQVITVEPAVDLLRLQTVLVLGARGGPTTGPEEADVAVLSELRGSGR